MALLVVAACARLGDAAPTFNDIEPGVRVTSAVLQAVVGPAATPRVYYIRGSSLVYSAASVDGGLTFTEDSGVRVSSLTVPALDIAISSITGLSILPLSGGGYRMLYSVIGSTGSYRIYSATSTDGLGWANDAGVRIDGGAVYTAFPSLINLGGGNWRVYYVRSLIGTSFVGDSVYTALSADQGLTFSTGVVTVAQTAGQVAATQRTDGLVRLYYTAPPAVGVATTTVIASALSTDITGTNFNLESGLRFSTGAGLGSITAPVVVKTTDSFRWRVYYNYTPFQVGLATANVFSAVTDAPDPQALAPVIAYQSVASPLFTVGGEVFSSGVTASLQAPGQTAIPATGLTRVNDQSFTATFNTQTAALGFWNLVVTNSNGQSTVLSNALLVDFLNGAVSLTDNLIRPAQGTKTSITVTIYDGGTVKIQIFTIDGHPVNTIFNGPMAAGTKTFFWNGQTADGRAVASGVYLVRTTGPKVTSLDKIIVIK